MVDKRLYVLMTSGCDGSVTGVNPGMPVCMCVARLITQVQDNRCVRVLGFFATESTQTEFRDRK